MQPVGDKVVLKKADLEVPEKGVVLLSSGNVLCEVVAVGPGIPYGRGEYYSLTAVPKDLCFIKEDSWKGAPSLRLRVAGEERPVEHRVIHEREILVIVKKEEL